MSACFDTSANGATGMPSPAISRFSARRSWADSSEPDPGKTATRPSRKRTVVDRDILELEGDDVDGAGKGGERRFVVIGGDGARRGDGEGRALRVGAIDVAGEAEFGGGDGQHAPELAAAENADDHARPERRSDHSSSLGRSSTAADWATRQLSRRLATSSSMRASTEAASSAALIAPERPIASVPTGMPAGIWTME